ncbi:MAG: non-ribosomal peptide synthetase, partial [Anaerolineales bacterium]
MIKQPDTSGMVVNSSPTDNLSRLTKAEHHQMLVEWNDTQTPLPEKICFHQLFEEQVERSPDAVAVVFRDKHLSYQELNSRANQLAHYLQRLGVKPDVLVGIYMERSLEMMVALLGIFKAGGAYVPLDINYPKDRIGYILDDTQVPVLLSQEHLIDNLPEYTAHLLNLDSDWPIIARESVENPFSHVTGDNLAYIAYTSGSTGKPKGVMNTHRGHTNYALWCTKGYNIESGKGSLVQSPIAFDFTNTTIFPPLLVGRSVTLVPDGNEIEALVSILRSRPDFSLVKITPAHLVLLNQLMSPTEMAGSTQALVVAADQLIGERLTTWQKYAPDTVLYNEYGPTETVAGCSAYRIGPDEQLTGPVSIGRPISNTYFYVLDNQLQPVPIGAPGELYIGGVGVARGYLNRPELTAKVFISDHFSDQPDARMYKTGDLVRYLPDGNLIFLGRIDHQIKIRGFRVELGEIEAVLGQHPAVSKSAVIVREDSPGDKRLVAYIVPELQETGLLREVRRFLKEKVPEYMIPSAFVLLDKLPLTSNGKLDREALPLPDQVRPELDSTIVAPRTPVEQRITAIWKDVLGMEQIGVHDNFFELGGHSLLATQVITRVRQAFQAEIPLGDFFDVPTVAGLATYLEENDITKPIRLMPPILPITPHTERKLSFAQQRLWFVDQLKPGTFTYNIPVAWRMVGLLNQTVLEKSLDEIIRRHESLRTTFSSTEGRPIQVISPPKTIKLSMTDLSELPEAKREMEARRLAAEE